MLYESRDDGKSKFVFAMVIEILVTGYLDLEKPHCVGDGRSKARDY